MSGNDDARAGLSEAIPLADDDDRAALRKLARDVAERDIAPHAAHWDETEEFAEDSLTALRKAELFTVTVGEEFGGMGMGDLEAAIVLEELARVDVSSAILCQLVFNGPPRAIEHLGNEQMQRQWLPLAAAGELFCIGITEPDAGSAATAMRAHLVPDAGGWRLEAYKNYVTGGHKAVACLVWCRFPGGEPGTGKGIGAVVVDLSKPGVSVAGTHRKMGLRGCTEAELAFDGVRIEPGDVLVRGDPADNSGLKTLLAHINHERCGNAAMCLGAAQGAIEYAMAYMH
ncbi:MAG TPA: acyl-CoA dehydrogenase family protein, partial [Acidimicrobiales bacterium]|nr:acyl-CoA dehydrogenase family protein [Acidimicrobiales bacterium]